MQFSVQRKKKSERYISSSQSAHVCHPGEKISSGDSGTAQDLVHPLDMVPLKPWTVGDSKTKPVGFQQSVNFQGMDQGFSPESVN